MANLILDKSGKTYPTDATVQEIEPTIFLNVYGNYFNISRTIYITVLTGDWSYEIINLNEADPAMANSTLFTPIAGGGITPWVVPPIVFNPFNQKLFIKSSTPSTFSITSNFT